MHKVWFLTYTLITVLIYICIIMLIVSIANKAFGYEINKTLVKKIQSYTVVLYYQNKPIGSGVIAREDDGVFLWTAEHVCSFLKDEQKELTVIYEYRNHKHTGRITRSSFDPMHTDICRVDIGRTITSPLRIGPLEYVNYDEEKGAETYKGKPMWREKELFLVQHFPEYPEEHLRVQKIYRVARSDENNWCTHVVGIVLPGMSGAPIFNKKGTIVGLGSGIRFDSPHPLSDIGLFETTSWVH